MQSRSLPSAAAGEAAGEAADALATQLALLMSTIHATWAAPRERRRMRTFGFVPAAVEAGVLKRDWRGLQVRVSPTLLRVILRDEGELIHRLPEDEMLLCDGPFSPSPVGVRIADGLNDLVRSYERWVEAREGREGRLSRIPAPGEPSDRRPVNALAETRRIQRLLTQTMRARGR